jgi:protein-L-isoaspartate(D-aspartate) O-methyltransferase
VLEVGTGSGYAAAVLSCLATRVVTVERIESLASAAAQRLATLGYANVQVHCGDGTLGWPDDAPYGDIVVTAAGPHLPPALKTQLAMGGWLVMPVGEDAEMQELLCVQRTGIDHYRNRSLGGVRFVPLLGAQGWPE